MCFEDPMAGCTDWIRVEASEPNKLIYGNWGASAAQNDQVDRLVASHPCLSVMVRLFHQLARPEAAHHWPDVAFDWYVRGRGGGGCGGGVGRQEGAGQTAPPP